MVSVTELPAVTLGDGGEAAKAPAFDALDCPLTAMPKTQFAGAVGDNIFNTFPEARSIW